jgi:hypothetical protein
MKRQPLTSSRTVLPDGRITHVYDWREYRIRVIDDAENALLIQDLFSDEGLLPVEKANILLAMLFADPAKVVEAVDDIEQLLADITWDIAGLDIDGTHNDEWSAEAPCFDFNQDAGRIRATLLSAYNLQWDEAKRQLTYAELCELLENAPPKSPFAQAVYYRTAKEPAATKYNAEEIENFRKAKAYYALDKLQGNPVAVQEHNGDDLFNALKRKATHG